MAEGLEWKETESFDTPHQGAVPTEEPQETTSYESKDLVRVYIKLEEESSVQEVLARISEEVLGAGNPELKSSMPDENLITAEVPYGQIAAIKEVEGVVSVELVGKAELTQAEESRQEAAQTGKDAETVIPLPGKDTEEENEHVTYTQQQEKTGMIQPQKAGQKDTWPQIPVLGVVLGVLILLAAAGAWLTGRKKRKLR